MKNTYNGYMHSTRPSAGLHAYANPPSFLYNSNYIYIILEVLFHHPDPTPPNTNVLIGLFWSFTDLTPSGQLGAYSKLLRLVVPDLSNPSSSQGPATHKPGIKKYGGILHCSWLCRRTTCQGNSDASRD